VTTIVVKSLQPLTSVTIRLYVVVVDGVTLTVIVVADDGSPHWYVSGAAPVLPDASRVDDSPRHIVGSVADAEAIGPRSKLILTSSLLEPHDVLIVQRKV